MFKTALLFIIGLSFITSCKISKPGKIDKPSNLILFIGDGMGLAHIYAGMTRSEHPLNMERFSNIGLVKTYSSDNYITDSGAGATAYSTGQKTRNGCLGLDSLGNVVPTILEMAKKSGLSTGIVVTCSVTHATPAAFAVHVASRDSNELIAKAFLGKGIDVVIGGGRNFFSKRTDHQNLYDSLRNQGYAVYMNLDSVRSSDSRIFCLTADEHDPPCLKGRGELLSKSTELAIRILSRNPKGFFLMVEGSQIDWGGHANDIDYLVSELVDMDNAIGKATDFAAQSKNTLIVVTADHETGGLAITGGNIKRREIQVIFATKNHTATMVPLFALGPGSNQFNGVYENTDVFYKMKKLLNLL